MTKFEVVLIHSPDLNTNTLNNEIDDFKTKLSSISAKIINQENWGLRDLSYTIDKHSLEKLLNKNGYKLIQSSLSYTSEGYLRKFNDYIAIKK